MTKMTKTARLEAKMSETINVDNTFNFKKVTVDTPWGEPTDVAICVGAGAELYDGEMFVLVRYDNGLLSQMTTDSFNEITTDEAEKAGRGEGHKDHPECHQLSCPLCYGNLFEDHNAVC